MTTLAGSPGQSGSTDGVGSAARFGLFGGMALDRGGNIYVTDLGNVHKLNSTETGELISVVTNSGIEGNYTIGDRSTTPGWLAWAKTALVDTCKENFKDLYFAALRGVIDPSTIDYIIVSHTEVRIPSGPLFVFSPSRSPGRTLLLIFDKAARQSWRHVAAPCAPLFVSLGQGVSLAPPPPPPSFS